MFKKIILSCMAVAAFAAFVLPASASAVTLTDKAGTVKAGAKLLGNVVAGTEATFVTTGGAGLVHCTTADLNGKVLRNEGGVAEGTISEAKFSGTGAVSAHNGLNECTGSFGNAYITVELPMCLRAPAGADTFEAGTEINSKCSEGVGKAEFIIGSTTAGACTYTSTNPVTGTFTTGGSVSTLTVNNTQAGSGSTLTSGGFLCPSSGQLKMSFQASTENGEQIFAS